MVFLKEKRVSHGGGKATKKKSSLAPFFNSRYLLFYFLIPFSQVLCISIFVRILDSNVNNFQDLNNKSPALYQYGLFSVH